MLGHQPCLVRRFELRDSRQEVGVFRCRQLLRLARQCRYEAPPMADGCEAARERIMSSLAGVLFVTGIAPHSLGEAFLNLYLANQPGSKVIGADLYPPPMSIHRPQLSTFAFDLNPLSFPSGYREFGGHLSAALETALDRIGVNSIDCLIQSAGVYAFVR